MSKAQTLPEGNKVELPGNVLPWATSQLAAEVDGRVEKILVEEGQSVLEGAPLENLAKNKQLMAFRHAGFWQCMDTVRDRNFLSHQWIEGSAPWKIWEDK